MSAPLPVDAPKSVGGYRLTGLLGEGGQGVVYLAESESGRRVAVKVLHGGLAAAPDVRRQLRREADAARRVASFCTAMVLEVDLSHDPPYIVSEYVEGVSLAERVRLEGPRGGGSLQRLAVATATALGAIHRAGIVHRDFKPSNVLLGPEGPVVIDFGIARVLEATATRSGVVGTPAYMSPEQVAGRPVGTSSDVFSWGCTMVFAASGRPAFGGGSIPEVMSGILYREPDLSAVPETLRALVGASLAKEPHARPTADQLTRALTTGPAVEGAPAQGPRLKVRAEQTRPAPAVGPPTEPVQRRHKLMRAAIVVVVFLASSAVAIAISRSRAQEPGSGASPTVSASLTAPAGPTLASLSQLAWVSHCCEHNDMVVVEFGGKPHAVTVGEKSMEVWELATGRALRRVVTARADHNVSVTQAERDGKPAVVIANQETLNVWNPFGNPRPNVLRPEKNDERTPFTALTQAVWKGKPVVVSVGSDVAAWLWDLKRGRQIGEIVTDHTDVIQAVTTGMQGGKQILVTGSADATVQRFDMTTGKPLGLPLIGHTKPVTAVAVTTLKQQPVIVSGSADATVRVWDLATGRPIGEPYRKHGDEINDVAFVKLGSRTVAMSVTTSEMRAWDLDTREPIGDPLPDGAQSLSATSVDGKPVAVTFRGAGDLRVYTLKLP
ncbi:serine/threonine-protein kinase [Nonomuraea sp. LPB2021202275-12-8]|uniref:serine/threonine-protein kinase n=1 Tax=Nonomuraea sp. LPB2021202275-12-8 TaxID=3120159 RepID=UPI00300CC3DC